MTTSNAESNTLIAHPPALVQHAHHRRLESATESIPEVAFVQCLLHAPIGVFLIISNNDVFPSVPVLINLNLLAEGELYLPSSTDTTSTSSCGPGDTTIGSREPRRGT